MKLRTAPLWLFLCVPSIAGAARFTVETPVALELATGERQISALADVRLTSEGIQSAFGIRLDRRGTSLAMLAPLVIGSRFLIKDRAGVEYRLTIHSVFGDRMAVEILRPGESPARPSVLDLRGPFRFQSFTIDGTRAATAYPDLELNPDGRYRLGGGLGKWQFDGHILALDGYYRSWGPADASPDGRSLTFRFLRGYRFFQVTFARSEDPPAPAPEKVAALESPPG